MEDSLKVSILNRFIKTYNELMGFPRDWQNGYLIEEVSIDAAPP